MNTTQTYYPVQSVQSAVESTKQILADITETFGSLPSILGVMANSPLAIESYHKLSILFSLSDFTPLEVHGIYLTIIREEGNMDLREEHARLLTGWLGYSETVIDAILSGKPTGIKKLDILLLITRELIQNKGAISDEIREQFFKAGYQESQLIDLLVPVAMKTMTAYLERLNR